MAHAAGTSILSARDQVLLRRRGMNDPEVSDFARLLEQARGWSAGERYTRLQTLDTRDRELLWKAAGLADPIATAALSHEGAFNLFQAPTAARDLDPEGFQSAGAALIWTFPPPGAPEALRQAWEEATQGLTEGEIMLCQGLFLPLPQFTTEGEIIGPGDTRWVDPCETPGFTWKGLVHQRYHWNELAGPRNPSYAETRDFLRGFLAALERLGVA